MSTACRLFCSTPLLKGNGSCTLHNCQWWACSQFTSDQVSTVNWLHAHLFNLIKYYPRSPTQEASCQPDLIPNALLGNYVVGKSPIIQLVVLS